jgi:hypothetical protein
MTGKGVPKWMVERDGGGGAVLKQSGKATYPLALKADTNIRDGFVEVKFKPISGSEDRAGGIVWRAKDANNYYHPGLGRQRHAERRLGQRSSGWGPWERHDVRVDRR